MKCHFCLVQNERHISSDSKGRDLDLLEGKLGHENNKMSTSSVQQHNTNSYPCHVHKENVNF